MYDTITDAQVEAGRNALLEGKKIINAKFYGLPFYGWLCRAYV